MDFTWYSSGPYKRVVHTDGPLPKIVDYCIAFPDRDQWLYDTLNSIPGVTSIDMSFAHCSIMKTPQADWSFVEGAVEDTFREWAARGEPKVGRTAPARQRKKPPHPALPRPPRGG